MVADFSTHTARGYPSRAREPSFLSGVVHGVDGIGYRGLTEMGLKVILLLAVLLPVLNSSAASEPGPAASMEVVPWPQSRPCNPCVPLQFGMLAMEIPLARLGRIFIHDGDISGVHLIGSGHDVRNAVMLDSIPRERHLGSYEGAGLLKRNEFSNAEAYFDRLGMRAATGPFATLRRIEGLDRAKRYTKASRGSLRAYAIQSDPPDVEQVYIVVDGESKVYALSGKISPELYDAILANMRVVPVP